MKRIVLVLGLLITASALAAGLTATWVNPTTNTDSSAIPASGPGSIASSLISYGTCSSDGKSIATVAGTVPVTGSATTGSIPNLAPGTWCASVSVTNTFGAASAQSNVASKVVAAPTPSAPTNFSLN